MSIEKRLERLEAILDARGLDWDHPRVASDHIAGANKMVAEEPPKKWRILEPGEVVCSGDMVNAKSNPPSDPPNGGGWVPAEAMLIGGKSSQAMGLYFARPVAEEPAKEPEHPAGPMPDPGEGYRILSKNPPEDLTPGDEFLHPGLGRWAQSVKSMCGGKKQDVDCWYRRKIELAKQPEPEYREPVLPADSGMACQFSEDGQRWLSGRVYGWVPGRNWVTLHNNSWKHARIKKDA